MFIATPLILFAGAAQLLLATIAKSFKDTDLFVYHYVITNASRTIWIDETDGACYLDG